MPSSSSTKAAKQSPIRILLVDNGAHGLQCRKAVLEDLGHKVIPVSSAVDALEMFSPAKFDMVVTGYRMPRVSGVDLIAHVKKMSPNTPAILFSGIADAIGLNEESTGADAVIQKSANEVSHLTRAVARLLRRKKPAASSGGGTLAKRKKA